VQWTESAKLGDKFALQPARGYEGDAVQEAEGLLRVGIHDRRRLVSEGLTACPPGNQTSSSSRRSGRQQSW
jgi:hypothetical protein